MRVVIQRVESARVEANGQQNGAIGPGLMILVGIEQNDDTTDVDWLCGKILRMRIFDDPQGVMNRSIEEVDGGILVVSQFTLHAQTKKGNRPSYIRAARPEQAIPLYHRFVAGLEKGLGKPIPTGVFGAHMRISMVNDGPVTIQIDSKNRE